MLKLPQEGIYMNEILKHLEQNSKYTASQLAAMLSMDEAAVKAAIAEYEKNHVILGYQAIVDWDKAGDELVTALIEVKVTPQRGDGFDRIAERIYQFEEVESVYLMSGAYDLTVIISGKSLKEVAQFVSARLSTIEGVNSTATHFILKKYKEKHCLFTKKPEQEERVLFI
jgi:DNA-binding Lrp family transcriptional regulator